MEPKILEVPKRFDKRDIMIPLPRKKPNAANQIKPPLKRHATQKINGEMTSRVGAQYYATDEAQRRHRERASPTRWP